MDVFRKTVPPLIVALALIAILWQSTSKNYAIDYYQYWIASKELSSNNIYDQKTQVELANKYFIESSTNEKLKYPAKYRRNKLKLSSTPLLYSVIINTGNFDTDLNIHLIISITSSLIAIFLLAQIFELSSLELIYLLIFYFVLFSPVKSDLLVGNVNQIQLLLFTVFLWLENKKTKNIASGIILALLILFKPNTFFVLFFISLNLLKSRQKLFNLYKGIALGAFIGIGITTIKFGSLMSWVYWSESLFKLISDPPYSLVEGNLSITHQMKYPFMLSLVFILISSYVSIKAKNIILTSNFGVLTNILFSTLVWPHYLIITIPLLLTLIKKTTSTNCILTIISCSIFCLLPSHNQFFGIPKLYIFWSSIISMLLLYALTIKSLNNSLEE